MPIFKCKMCGGTIEINKGETVGTCDSCGTLQTLPKLDGDKKAGLYDRADNLRRNNDYDKAALIYEQILNEDPSDSEVYWSLVLCNYGVEYVEDPKTHKRIPTVNRTQFTSIFDNDNYKSAIKYADDYQKSIYTEQASEINEIQKGILAVSRNEEPFDVFICYKETDISGRRTQDSVIATDIYHQLTNEGFKVFFSRITLEDKIGTAYEPYIFAALNSSKVMVVLGTKPEYFNAVWVKNEWSRYLSLVKQSKGQKILIPAYRDMNPYDLPEEFSHLQAQDMSKIGFMQDLIRGIKKIVSPEEKHSQANEVFNFGNASIGSLFERTYIFLEDGNFARAGQYAERILDMDPKNAEAYLIKLMVDLKVSKKSDLAELIQPFDNNFNYQKIQKYDEDNLGKELRGYVENIKIRNHDRLYEYALELMNNATTEDEYLKAASNFKSLPGYKDSDELYVRCTKEATYTGGCREMARNIIPSYECAIEKFSRIPDYRDSSEKIDICNAKLVVLKEEQRKQNVINTKNDIYNKACYSLSYGITNKNIDRIEEAIKKFSSIEDWRDSNEKIAYAKENIYRIKQQKEKNKKITKFVLILVGAVVGSIILILILAKIFTNSGKRLSVPVFNENKIETIIETNTRLPEYYESELR